jgi:hypothetical protein
MLYISFSDNFFSASAQRVLYANMAFVQPSTAKDTNDISGNFAQYVAKIADGIMGDVCNFAGCLGGLLGGLRYRLGRRGSM